MGTKYELGTILSCAGRATYNPDAVELDALVELADLRRPPVRGAQLAEVREGRVGSVVLCQRRWKMEEVYNDS